MPWVNSSTYFCLYSSSLTLFFKLFSCLRPLILKSLGLIYIKKFPWLILVHQLVLPPLQFTEIQNRSLQLCLSRKRLCRHVFATMLHILWTPQSQRIYFISYGNKFYISGNIFYISSFWYFVQCSLHCRGLMKTSLKYIYYSLESCFCLLNLRFSHADLVRCRTSQKICMFEECKYIVSLLYSWLEIVTGIILSQRQSLIPTKKFKFKFNFKMFIMIVYI